MKGLTIPQIKRLAALSKAGLSDAGVAIVLNLDYGLEVDASCARYYRRTYGGGPRPDGQKSPGVAKNNSANFAAVGS